MECDILPISALTLLFGQQKGHLACKKLDVGLLVVVILLELCTTYSSRVQLSPPRPSSFASINTG